MPLTDKQQEYLNNCYHRWNVKTGATGSGKSFVDFAITIPKRILAARGEGLLVLLGNTRGTLERNIIEPMRTIWPGNVGIVRGDNTIEIFGRKVYALGADNKKHVARIQGATFEYVYGDEVTTWNQEVFQMLKSRLRCEHSHFDGTCNPDNPQHWFKKFLESDADAYNQSYTIDDNPFLPADFVANLKKEYAGTVYYDRYILGQWTAAEGVIYRQIADDSGKFIVSRLPEILFATIGVDFGGNGSATAFNCSGFTRGFQQVITLREYYHKGIMSPVELESAFMDFVRDCQQDFLVHDAYCDSAEQTLIRGLKTACANAGLSIDIHNARKGPINDRIRFFCRLQAAGRHFLADKCPVTLEAFRSAVWDHRHLTKDVRLDDGTYNIDSLDAQEYAVEPYMRQILQMS